MTIEELKPCPFCGGEASIGTVTYPEDSEAAKLNGRNVGYYPSCITCAAQINFDLCFASKKKATKAWNQRIT